jgi:4-hydroxy-3-polyprenylbenzoate decarboxylase
VGIPPQEDRYLGDAAQQALNPLVRLIHPEVRSIWAYYESGFHHLLVVSVESRYTREHIKTALGLLGQGQLSLTKAIVLVNPDVNPGDPSAVLAEIRRNFNTPQDFQLIARAPGDTLDFATPGRHRGSKMIIDATGDDAPPTGPVPIPADIRALAPAAMAWRLVGNAMLVVQIERGADGRDTVQALVKSQLLAAIKIIAVVSEDIDINDDTSLIWGIFTRFDPATDTVFTEMRMDGAVPVYEGIMGIDASMKDGYPEPLVMSDEIVEKVTRRWDEYWR